MFGGGLGASAAGSTVVEKNLDRITLVFALMFTISSIVARLLDGQVEPSMVLACSDPLRPALPRSSAVLALGRDRLFQRLASGHGIDDDPTLGRHAAPGRGRARHARSGPGRPHQPGRHGRGRPARPRVSPRSTRPPTQAVPALATKWTSDAPSLRPRTPTDRCDGYDRRPRARSAPPGPSARPAGPVRRRLGGDRRPTSSPRSPRWPSRATPRWPGPASTWSPATTTWCRARRDSLSGLGPTDDKVAHHDRPRPTPSCRCCWARRSTRWRSRRPSSTEATTNDRGGLDHHAGVDAPSGLGSVQAGGRRRHDRSAGAQRHFGGPARRGRPHPEPTSTGRAGGGARRQGRLGRGAAGQQGVGHRRSASATRVQSPLGRRGVLRDQPGQPDLRQPALPAGHHQGGRPQRGGGQACCRA